MNGEKLDASELKIQLEINEQVHFKILTHILVQPDQCTKTHFVVGIEDSSQKGRRAGDFQQQAKQRIANGGG